MSKIRKPYEGRTRAPFKFYLPTRTQEHFRKECEIDTILKQFQITGKIGDEARRNMMSFLDITSLPDLSQAAEAVSSLESAFDALDSKTRALFSNNPYNALQFLGDPSNASTLEAMGFIPRMNPGTVPTLDVTVPTEPALALEQSTTLKTSVLPKTTDLEVRNNA